MRTSNTSQDCHSRKKGLAVAAATSFFFLFVTSWSTPASSATSPPTTAVAAVAYALPASPLKHRLPPPDEDTLAPRPAVLEVSRSTSTPRPQLPPPVRRSVPVTSHSTDSPRRPPVRQYNAPAQNQNHIPAGNIQAYARSLVSSSAQYSCLANIIERESGWNVHAANPEGAYGIPQALPGAKMSSAGSDWRDNPETQIRWMISYIAERYGSPCSAWNFWQGHSWY